MIILHYLQHLLQLPPLTLAHILISLLGIGAGFAVVFGMSEGKTFPFWTVVFLAATVATSVTGFIFFPFHHFSPAHGVGILSLVVLAVAIFARYVRHLAGAWCQTYVISAVLAQYLNFFVLVMQSFQHVPGLKTMPPAQLHSTLVIVHGVFLAFFIMLAVFGVTRFRPGRAD